MALLIINIKYYYALPATVEKWAGKLIVVKYVIDARLGYESRYLVHKILL